MVGAAKRPRPASNGMKVLLGQKIEMSQRFNGAGAVVPVTLILATPNKVTQVKSKENDQYEAIQVGFGQAKHTKKPILGHLKQDQGFAHLREFRTDGLANKKNTGDILDVKQFQIGDKVDVIGIGKGKGFQGVVKRHGFHGHNETHGTKDAVRMPGSIGSGGIQRVFKGLRMGGRMGNATTTIKNLEIIWIDEQKNILAIKGAVPGSRGALLKIVGK